MNKNKLIHCLLNKPIIFAVFFSFGANLSYAAAPDILPGLWENKIDVSSKSGQIEQALKQAQAMLEAMPPEQQKMMKDMMAKQGVNFDFASRTIQTCLTQEQINNFHLSQSDSDCNNTIDEGADGHYKISMQCDQSGSGTGEYFIKNNKSYTGTMIMDVDMGGQKDTMTIKQEGKWMSSDCGDLTEQ